MKKIIALTNKYIVLATPLILFSLISTIYLAVATNGRVINILIALILFVLMSAAFISGWFKMIKTAIINPKLEEPNALIREFPEGVGEYFLSSVGLIVNVSIVSLIVILLSYAIGMYFIGDPKISPEAFSKAIESTSALKAFLASLTKEQLSQINLWNYLILATMTISYFLLMFYIPAMFFKTKNPFKALFVSFKDLFNRKIIKTFGIYLLIFVVNFLISIFSALFTAIPIAHFIITLANFYFITLVGVGVCYYYYHNFVQQIGQNIDERV